MTRRNPVIAGNWKMNLTWAGSVKLAQSVANNVHKRFQDIDIVLCPPFTSIKGVGNVIEFDNSELKLGAQNVHETLPEGTAACTGEVSVAMLKDLLCSFCIIGHSERREGQFETDELVNAKARLLVEHGITPIICCGESAEVNEAGGSLEFVTAQMRAALAGFTAEQAASLVIAYEPIWAIGTGNVPTPEGADAICGAIRALVAELFGEDAADKVRILYGGSMKPENAEQFLSMPNIDGGLIGGASLDAGKFTEIIKICEQVKAR